MPVPKVRGKERSRRKEGGWRRKRSDTGQKRSSKSSGCCILSLMIVLDKISNQNFKKEENFYDKKTILNKIAIFIIRIYQKLTFKKGHRCLHFPTCSNYGILAYEKYPFLLATRKTIIRIRYCLLSFDNSYFDYP